MIIVNGFQPLTIITKHSILDVAPALDLPLNIDLCDFFLIMNHEDIVHYADDNTPYFYGKNIDEVVRFLEESSHVIFK